MNLDADSGDAEPSSPRVEHFASQMTTWVLPAVLTILCVGELATWAPNYMTWPLWADHDVFSTAALAWDAGVLPYRDLRGNNFPGTTYLFWILGKLFGFGWAQAPTFYGFDASLLMLFGLAMVTWSRRCFGAMLPGLVGFGGFLGYYLALDYSQAAQRDWQGPAFATIGLMVVQTWTGRFGRATGALVTAFGLIIRPQAILFLPGHFVAVASEAKGRGRSVPIAVMSWGILLAVGIGLGMLPLILSGLWPDFLASLKVVGYGGKYNHVSPFVMLHEFWRQLLPLRIDIVPIAIVMLWGMAARTTRKTAIPWLVVFACVLMYRPLSPHAHAYLTHPIMVAWSVLAAVLVRVVMDGTRLPHRMRLVAILLIMGLGVSAKPRFCNPNGSLEAFAFLRAKTEPAPKPTGYARNPDVAAAGVYEWKDYRNVLHYLRTQVPKSTRVANCLREVPAITGPTARLPVFPAESIAWLTVVNEADQQVFATHLREDEDSVVVWSPVEKSVERGKLPQITAVIEEFYEHEMSFGAIEVWARKGRQR